PKRSRLITRTGAILHQSAEFHRLRLTLSQGRRVTLARTGRPTGGAIMTFGKRSKGEGHPARDLLPPMEEMAPANIRMTSAKPAIDKGFLALAAGVVLVSGGAALAAPSVLDMFGNQVRPIEQVIAGLDRSQA